jgi:hypothetical protein
MHTPLRRSFGWLSIATRDLSVAIFYPGFQPHPYRAWMGTRGALCDLVDENGTKIHKAAMKPWAQPVPQPAFNPPKLLDLRKADGCGWLLQPARARAWLHAPPLRLLERGTPPPSGDFERRRVAIELASKPWRRLEKSISITISRHSRSAVSVRFSASCSRSAALLHSDRARASVSRACSSMLPKTSAA